MHLRLEENMLQFFFPEENIWDWFWNYFQDGGLHGQHAEIMFERLWLNFPGIRDQNEKKTGIFFYLHVDMQMITFKHCLLCIKQKHLLLFIHVEKNTDELKDALLDGYVLLYSSLQGFFFILQNVRWKPVEISPMCDTCNPGAGRDMYCKGATQVCDMGHRGFPQI